MIDSILKHRTIRKYDKNKDVEQDKLNTILEAAFRAPTTGNMQVYSIVVNKNIDVKKQLLEVHFNQQMVVEAPIILTFLADFNRFNKWCKLRKANPEYNNFLSFTTAMIDALLAAQNACIAAEDLGLGTCYLGTTTYNADKLIQILKCPKDVVPITTLVIGYPLEIPALTDRLPFEAIVHNEFYKDYSDVDINKIYAEKEALPLTKQLIIENQLENLAQIFTDKRYTKKDNEFFSEKFLQVIKEQGFI